MCLGTRKRTRHSEQRLSTQDTIWRTRQGIELDHTQESCWHILSGCKTVVGAQYFFSKELSSQQLLPKDNGHHQVFSDPLQGCYSSCHMDCAKRFKFPKTEDKVMQNLCGSPWKAALIWVTHTGAFGSVYWDATLCKQNPCEKRPVWRDREGLMQKTSLGVSQKTCSSLKNLIQEKMRNMLIKILWCWLFLSLHLSNKVKSFIQHLHPTTNH